MKKTRKLIVPIALLVLAVLAVTSTTFAWFTVNSTVTGYMQGAGVLSSEDMLFIVSIQNSAENGGDPTDTANWTSRAEDDISQRALYPTYSGLTLLDLTYLRTSDTNLKQGDDSTAITRSDSASPTDGLFQSNGTRAKKNSDYLEFTYNFWHTGPGNNLELQLNSLSLDSYRLSGGNQIAETTSAFTVSEYSYFASFFDKIIVSHANYAAFKALFTGGVDTNFITVDGVTVFTSGAETAGVIANEIVLSNIYSPYIIDVAPTGQALSDYITANYVAYRVGNATTGKTYYFNIGAIAANNSSVNSYKVFQSTFDTAGTVATSTAVDPDTTPGTGDEYTSLVYDDAAVDFTVDDTLATKYSLGANTAPSDLKAYYDAGYVAYEVGGDIYYFDETITAYALADYNYVDALGGIVNAADVLRFYGTTTAPTGTALTAYHTAGYSTFSNNGVTWYFNMNGSYSALARDAARVMFSSTDPATGAVSRVLWNPSANAGYDSKTTGVRNYKFDVQELYALVQRGDYGALPSSSYDPYDGVNGIDMTGITDLNQWMINNPATGVYNIAKFETVTTSAANGTPIVARGPNDYYHAAVTVTVWLEGWDSDCFNAILGTNIKTDMTFTTAAQP